MRASPGAARCTRCRTRKEPALEREGVVDRKLLRASTEEPSAISTVLATSSRMLDGRRRPLSAKSATGASGSFSAAVSAERELAMATAARGGEARVHWGAQREGHKRRQ